MSLSSPLPSLYPITSFAAPRHPSIPPTSPFLSPFDPSATIKAHLTSELSPATSLNASPTPSIYSSPDLGSPSKNEDFVRRAYVASKASVDLIRVLDLKALPEMRNEQSNPGRPGDLDHQSDAAPPVPPTTPVKLTSKAVQEVKDTESRRSTTSNSAPPRSSHRASSRPAPLDNRSFLRMSSTTASLSDFTPPEDIPLKSLSIASGDDRADASSRRSSAGTFGRARRWSLSTSSLLDPTGSFRGAKQASETFLSDNEGDGDDVSMTSSQKRRRRRHQSLSSTTSTSVSGAAPMPSEVIAVQNSKGFFPSPTQPKKTHRKPESDAAITAHLLKTASRDPRKIVPAVSVGGLSPPIQLHPPSSGTPLKGGLVEEEFGMMTDDDWSTPPRRRDPLKTRSKIEQVLGEGAIAAGAQMEYERQAWRDALQMPQKSPGPVPPYRGHRATHSSPNAPRSPHSIFSEHHTPRHAHHPSEPLDIHFHTRSGSYESIPSLHPSIADSLTQLIPPNHPHAPTVQKANMKALPSAPRGPPVSRIDDESPQESPTEEKRAQLQRRMRALEKRLGERLIDDGTGKLVIQPAEGTTTILADVPDFWPPTPTSSVPDWAKDDVVPRTVPVPQGTSFSESTMVSKKVRPRGHQAKDGPTEDLKIYVGRQTQVSQYTDSAGMTTPLNPQDSDIASTRTPNRASEESPQTNVYDPADEDAIMASNRRRQLVKLQRLLGEVLTPAYLPPSRASLGSRPDSPLSHQPSQRTVNSVDSPLSDQVSFMDMSIDDFSYPMIKSPTPPKEGGSILKGPWASKLKQSMSISSGKSKKLVVADDESFVNFGGGRGSGTFGRFTPLNNTSGHTRVRSNDSSTATSSSPPPLGESRWNSMDQASPAKSTHVASQPMVAGTQHSSFDNYKQSLQGLLYLAENNPAQLVKLADSLDETPGDTAPRRPPRPDCDSPSPPSPVLRSPTYPLEESFHPVDPNSEEARRKRVGKLSNFFGEGLDFTSPSLPLRQAAWYDIDLASPTPTRENTSRSASGMGRYKKNRLDVLDGMLGELWRGVQSEFNVGGMRRDEVDRLGEMFGAYKWRRENMTGWEEL